MWRKFWGGLTNRSPASAGALVVAVAWLVAGLWLNVDTARESWDKVGADSVTPTSGSVKIVTCDRQSKSGSKSRKRWTCHGRFTSDDGRLHIEPIAISVPQTEDAGSVVPARVSGAGAKKAWNPGDGSIGAVITIHVMVALFVMPPVLLLGLVWVAGQPEPRPALPRPKPLPPRPRYRKRRDRRAQGRRR